MPRKIEISHRTIIFTVLFLIGLWFLFYVKDILLQFFVALFIMVVLNPTVRKLSKYKIPRGISVLIVYLGAIALIVVGLAGVIPPLIDQTSTFVSNLEVYLKDLGISPFILDQLNIYLLSQLGSIPSLAVRYTVGIFSNIVEVITVLIFSFYLLVSREKLEDQISYVLGETKGKQIGKLIDSLEKELGGWARGQIILMFLVGLATYMGLSLLGVPNALPLAIIAGLLEAVPYVGPFFAAIPSALIGFGVSSVMGLATIALAFLIQQLENYIFVPKVMERTVGVSPVIILLALSVGFRLAGIVGVFISVPVVIALRVILRQYWHQAK